MVVKVRPSSKFAIFLLREVKLMRRSIRKSFVTELKNDRSSEATYGNAQRFLHFSYCSAFYIAEKLRKVGGNCGSQEQTLTITALCLIDSNKFLFLMLAFNVIKRVNAESKRSVKFVYKKNYFS